MTKQRLEYILDIMFPLPSKILRLAKFRHQQIRGRITDFNNGYCAMGALYKGLGWDGENSVPGELEESISPLYDLFTEKFGHNIPYFNDQEGKSFDWFADKFEEIGY